MTTFGFIILGLIFAIPVIYSIVYTIKHYYDGGDIAIMIVEWVLTALITVFVWLFIAMIADMSGTEYLDHSYNVKLYGLSNGTVTKGHMVLGTGNIDGVQYIYYNTKSKDGYITTYKMEYDRCKIKEDAKINKSYLKVDVYYTKPRFIFKYIFKDCFFEKQRYTFHMRPQDINEEIFYDISKY